MVETPRIKKPKKIKKRRLAVFIIFLLIFCITAGYFNNYLPPPQGLLNLLEPKTTAIPAVPLSGDAAPLGFQLNKPLVTDFSSAPEGESPLTLQFLDQSRGNPESWDWNFGDTTSSTLQHPVHQYTVPGNFTVSLTVIRGDGSRRTVTRNNILGINQSSSQNILVDTLREGYIRKGSEVTFLSTEPNASVIIDGISYNIPVGSVVKMRTGSDTEGRMIIRNGRLVSFAFPDMTLFVNGTQVASGNAGDSILPSYRYFLANLTYVVSPVKGEVRQIVVNDSKIRAGMENSRILITYHSRATNEDLTLVSYPAFFEGTATSFTISDAVIADFEPGSGFSGPAPFNVAFRDNSAGSPDRWHWDFGDGTRSDEQHPVHMYSVPGAYTVTLSVSQGDQKDTVIRKKAVIASPPRVIANFSARPLKGPAPLTVRFTDASINAPSSWIWTFGPNSTPLNSSERDPVVTYSNPGSYTVSLTSGNVYGSSDLTLPKYITVTEPFRIPDKSIIVRTGKQGYIEKDSVVEFVVLDRPASISINGGYHELAEGSVVRLEAMSDQQGEIYIDRNEILKFSYPNMGLYVNGDLVAEGEINNIYVPAYSGFRTALSYYLVPNSAYTYIAYSGYDVLGDLDTAWIRITNIGTNPGGNLRLISSSNSTYLDGAMNQTVHDWVIE